MENLFLRVEDEFQQWVKDGYPGAEEKTVEYLQHLSDPKDESKPREGTLWEHQWGCLLRIVYSYEIKRELSQPNGVLLNVVTGGGKTAVIAAAMAWLRLAHNVQNFVIICPNLIVRDRLEEDFKGGKVFKDRSLLPAGGFVAQDDFDLVTLGAGGGSAGLLGSRVVLGNIHQFYESNASGQQNVAKLMNGPDFVLFNDEAHNSPAPEWEKALETLRPKTLLRVDTTATPDRADHQTPDSAMIYEYLIDDALADRLVKTPVVYKPNISTVELTYTDAITGETRGVEEIDWEEVDRIGLNATQWVTDDKPMRQQMGIALQRLKEQERRAKGRYQPLLFVVAVSKLDAQRAQRTLQNYFKMRTLLVTEDSPDRDRQMATNLNKQRLSGNPYKAVVSVLMLREGWDMPEVGVILLLRKFGSRVYGQQVIGRGLRRVRRGNIDEKEQQICAVVDHPKLEHQWLWDIFQPKIRENVGIDEEFDETEDLPEPPPRQELTKPENVIEIPEPDEDDICWVEPEVTKEAEPLKNWREVLNALEYGGQTTEITGQNIDSVGSKELDKDGWTMREGPPDDLKNGGAVELTKAELAEGIQAELMQTAANLLEHVGHSDQLKGRIYGILLEHVRSRFLDGASLGLASRRQLETVRRVLPDLEKAVKETPGLIDGMVKYGG